MSLAAPSSPEQNSHIRADLQEFIIRVGSVQGRCWAYVHSTRDGHVFQHRSSFRLFPDDSVQRLANGEIIPLCFEGMRSSSNFFGDWSVRDQRLDRMAEHTAKEKAFADGETKAKAHPRYRELVEQLTLALEQHLANEGWTSADYSRVATNVITAVFNPAHSTAYVVTYCLNSTRSSRICQAFAEVSGIQIPRRASNKTIEGLLEPFRNNLYG